MPTRFAVKTGNWSDTTVWDSGALPVAGDVIYPNGFTVTLDQDINVGSLNNNISPVTIPNIATPAMTSNTQPSGIVISSNNSGTAYYAFNQDNLTNPYWNSGVANTGWLGYTFSSGKVIKRYFIKQQGIGQAFNPKTWTFEGSNDGFATAGVQLDQVLSYTTNSNYTSVLLANTTSYTSYRINITAAFSVGSIPGIAEFEMTESTTASPVYGVTTGGSFTVPASLSGTRNIVQSGAGIVSNNVNTVVTTAHTSGNTVNFNVASGGYIFNPSWHTNATSSLIGIGINGTGAINFNGDIYGTTTNAAYTTSGQININANAIVTINGNIYPGKGHGSAGATGVQINLVATNSNSAVLNVNGNIIASNYDRIQYNIQINSSATVNITGNLTSDLGVCLQSISSSIVNIPTGTITVTNSNSSPAIIMTSLSSLLTMNSPVINKSNVNAVIAYKIRFYSTGTPYWVFQNSVASDITLAYGAATGSYPNEADVRFGTTYSASPTRTGTLRVPLPQYVSQGVLTDNTTGTAYLSATDVWNVLTTNITTAGSIGERLKNASTVQTNGDQLAAYIV